jgi:DNA-binding CsgD family transcriptional regulator
MEHSSDSDRPRERTRPRADLFHAIFEKIPNPVVLIDDDRRYVDGNSAARRFIGVSRAELLKHRTDDFTAAEVLPEVERLWATFLRLGRLEGRYPMRLANGLEQTIDFQAVASVRPGRHLASFRVAPNLAGRGELRIAERQTRNLTAREREVLTYLARGFNAATIAEFAYLSPDTVRTHVRNAMRKLDARSRPHAIAMAIKGGQIDP